MNSKDNNPAENNPLENDSHGGPTNEKHVRMLDLMIQRATSGLSDSQQQELDQLISLSGQNESQSQLDELEKIELTAAAVDMSLVGREALPDSVRDRVLFNAGQHFSSDSTVPGSVATTGIPAAIESTFVSPDAEGTKVQLPTRQSRNGLSWREAFALAVTAASLFVVLSGWNPFFKADIQTPIAKTPMTLSATEKMARFIESKPSDLVRETWIQVDKNYVGAGGEILWSDEAQEGYMVFTGIKPNDPLIEQFQLWIFDMDPAQAHPVDGGVFDIAASEYDAEDKIIVPIKLHIPVEHAVQFAVTVERPGGVTVSKRERIPVLAKVAAVN